MAADLKAKFPQYSPEDIDAGVARAEAELGNLWKNDQYQVHVIKWYGQGPDGADIIQLSIKRLDRGPARDWRDFQRIKTQLCGPECEGIELYPAESRLADGANQFHLWVVDDPKYRWPVGYFSGRAVADSGEVHGTVQRAREEVDKQYD